MLVLVRTKVLLPVIDFTAFNSRWFRHVIQDKVLFWQKSDQLNRSGKLMGEHKEIVSKFKVRESAEVP
jgi:hypothetical protein